MLRNCINNCKNHPNTTSFVKRHCKNVSEENMFVLIWKKFTNNCKNHPNTRWHWTKMTWVKIRSCSVWDTDSSNGVTFMLCDQVFEHCLYGEALSAPCRSQSETRENNCRNMRQSWSTAPKPKSHVPTVWLPTVTRHDVTGSWSWTWGGWGGDRAGHCQGLRGKMGLREGGVQLTGEELLGPSGCWAGARDVPGCLRDLQESTRTKVTRRPS